MSFVSWEFAVLLIVVFCLYWSFSWRNRIRLLWISSYFFYGYWDARLLALIFMSTAVDFLCSVGILNKRPSFAKELGLAGLPTLWLLGCALLPFKQAHLPGWVIGITAIIGAGFFAAFHLLWRLPEARRPRAFLILSIATNLGTLFFFKYFNFFADSAAMALNTLGWQPHWTLLHVILPVGISFYTFQSLSYVVDAYRGQSKPTDDLELFAAYLSYFPQLVAGPIERCRHLLPQMQQPAVWNVEHLHCGLRLILIGFFKKVFVADNCALLANYSFDSITKLNAPWAIIGVLAFAFQIYGDFSGYSDIARGTSRLLGIDLARNFAFPYFARNPSDFWARWHITLSTWFRDYVYIPLGGNRAGQSKTFRNLMVTMLLAGLWHGASWNFVLWGGYYGALLVLYRVCALLQKFSEAPGTLSIWASTALMFSFTLLGWVLFRCHSLAQISAWFAALGNWHGATVPWLKPLGWLLIHSVPLVLLQAVAWKSREESEMEKTLPWAARGVTYAVLLLAVASSTANDVEFIYFQF
jgi:alginate O-acetyltransferase complex protein AlgI